MINYPPIDKLLGIAECRYALVTAVSKRARQLMEAQAVAANEKPVSRAVNELYEDKLHIVKGRRAPISSGFTF
ncbi:MAG: DNA-directed RNA polymerase subunit omega [Clostridia bacterium]|nr:DNA-directed RNA polymerase subunit omega [Clostridia bacterium]